MALARLADRTYADIISRISQLGLAVGDRLPAEIELAKQFGVSRTVVREALARLASDGITATRRGAGSYLTRRPSALLTQHMHLDELPVTLGTYEVRFVLEAEAARLAALRRSEYAMIAIASAMKNLRRALLSGGSADLEDMALHHAIMSATGNEAFSRTFIALNENISRIMKAGIEISRSRSASAIEAMVNEHEDIVDAILLRDGDRAALAMRWHLSQGRRRLMP